MLPDEFREFNLQLNATLADLPESMQFRMRFHRGRSILFWLALPTWEGEASEAGCVLGEESLAGTLPLVREIFGNEEAWLRSFRKVAHCDCSVGLMNRLGWRGVCLVGGRSIPSVWAIGVQQQLRGQGLGRGLLQHSLRLLKASGHKSVRAHVHPENEPSIRLFRQAGFQQIDSTESFLSMARLEGRAERGDFWSQGLEAEVLELRCEEEGVRVVR